MANYNRLLNKRYVTFKQAKILRSLKFNYRCEKRYFKGNLSRNINPDLELVMYNRSDFGGLTDYYVAPTLSIAQQWLREKYKIDIVLIPVGVETYIAQVLRPGQIFDVVDMFGLEDTAMEYDACLQEALDKALEIAKELEEK